MVSGAANFTLYARVQMRVGTRRSRGRDTVFSGSMRRS